MESFWVTVVFLWLAATGVLVAFVILYWFNAAAARAEELSRASRSRTAATGRMQDDRRVT